MRLSALIAVAVVVLISGVVLNPGVGKAENEPVQYHSLGDTFGCGDPAATLALTDQTDQRRKSASWIKSTFNDGHCVSITPKSPWRFVSRAGEVALMDYAGTVGPPGSYYIRVDQMVDPNGQHPGDNQTAPAGNPPAAAATPPVDTASPTALAPTTAPASQPAMAPPAPQPAGSAPTWTTSDIILLLVALVLAFIGGFVLGRRR